MIDNSFIDVKKAKKLLDINKMLTQSLKIEEILQNLIVAANELIEVSDVLIIYLYDEKSGKLKFAEGEGIDKEKLRHIAFSPGESISGKVFVEKKSKLFTSEQEIDAYMNNMDEENYRYYYQGVYKRKIKSAFCVPIVNKDHCFGIVVVDNFNQDGIFTKEDMHVIEVIADQSAIAIDNSNVYQSLKEKNDLLSQSITTHNLFYKQMIAGGGINKILSLLETIINSSVKYLPETFYNKKDTLFPIVRGKDVLGVLELAKPFHLFSNMEQMAIEHASLSIALELIKNNALYEKELHFREEVFNQLLEEELTKEDIKRVLPYIKWKEKWDLQCIIIEGNGEPLWENNKITDKEWFVRSIEQITNSVSSHSFIFTRVYQVIIILPIMKDNVVDKVIKNIELNWRTKKSLLYGIGRKTTIHNLTLSYKEAIRSIRYAKSNKGSNIVEYAKLGIERLLHEVDPTTINMYIQDKLNKLLVMDSSLIETLQQFIDQNKNHKETAKILHIHPNTLYYRLRKIEEILEIELNNEKEWIDLVIALQLFMASNKKEI